MLSHTQYRLRLLLDLIRHFFLPALTLHLIVQTFAMWTLPWWQIIPLHCLWILVWAIARIRVKAYLQDREAASFGAAHITRVRGRWPGNLDVLFKMMKAFQTSYLLDVYSELFKEYKCTTLNLRILWVDQIITMDKEHIKYLLATGFDKFWRGDLQKERMETFLGDGIFNRDDAMWKMHRANARPFFVKDRIAHVDVFEKNFNRVLSILEASESNSRPLDAQDLFARFTLDSAAEFLFGNCIDTLSATLPSPAYDPITQTQNNNTGAKGSATSDSWGAFAQAFESCQQIITTRARLGYIWPLFELFRDRSLEHQKTIRRWLDPLVDAALRDKEVSKIAGIESTVADKTFLQHLADSTADPGVIRDQLLSMLLASRDSTAVLITYVCYFLALHPDVLHKLRGEILAICGPDGCPDHEKLKELRYLRAVINETLRLFPPVPLNIRESRASCVLPPSDDPGATQEPLYMAGGVNIVWLPMLLHRNRSLWGEDAEEFIPERWIDPESISKYVANPFMYGPFSYGPRTCLGRGYALNEASYFLVRLVQNFDTLELAPDCQPGASLPRPEWKTRRGRQAKEKIWPAAAMTLYVKGGLWMKFRRSETMLQTSS